MKRFSAMFLVLVLLAAAGFTFAEEMEITVLRENYIEYKGYNSMKGEYLAQIQNNTSAGYYVYTGTITLLDADGNALNEKSNFLGGSKYLAPGESSFIRINADIPEGTTVADYTVDIPPAEKRYTGEDLELQVDEAVYDPTNESNPQIYITVTNPYDEPHYVALVFTVEDAEGNIYYLGQDSYGLDRLGGHSTIYTVQAMPSEIRNYVKDNGITLTQVEVSAFAENK